MADNSGDLGSWAAAWQARYAGLVPKGSLFSFLQRLGMTYGRWGGVAEVGFNCKNDEGRIRCCGASKGKGEVSYRIDA